jgi:putative two-component system response regulator
MQTTKAATALVVEPDVVDRGRLRQFLAADGYEALAARDAHSALELAVRRPPGVVLVDVELPGRDAAALTRRMRALPTTRQATIIAVADPRALNEVGGVMAAGVDDFLAKPFGRPELHERIETVARTRASYLVAEAPEAVVATLANAVATTHPATGSHSQRVARLAANLAAAVGMSPEELEAVVTGALLHDVGKLGVPEAVLEKQGPLSVDEWTLLRRHAEAGEAICRPLAMASRLGPIIRHHHERWDGSGYPDGLAGEAIPVGARVVAGVDALDAIVHDRPYRPARSPREAVAEILSGSGSQFDPSIANRFIVEFALDEIASATIDGLINWTAGISTDDPQPEASGLTELVRGGR